MSSDREFLSFKGLKYYNPSKGWNELNFSQETYIHPIHQAEHFRSPELKEQIKAVKSAIDSNYVLFDPLMKDLLDRIYVNGPDALSTAWKDIAEEIYLLEQYYSTRCELIEQMNILDQEANELRAKITENLDKAQELADQQIFTANLRTKISVVAQNRLLSKLEKVGTQINKHDVSKSSCVTKESV